MRVFYSILTAVLLAVSCAPVDKYITITGYAQGGTYSVKLNLKGADARPEEIRDSVDAILSAIDRSLSGYNKNSLLSRFNAGERIIPDSLFLDMYEYAYDIYDETDGIIDVASAPLFDIWGFGFKTGDFPDEEDISRARSASGMKRLHRDIRAAVAEDGTLSSADLLKDPSGDLPKLNYNAVAQGYSCDVVARYLYSIGVKDMMVNIGEIFCDGLNPSGKNWSLGIDRPVDGNNDPGSDIQGIFRSPDGPHGIVTSGNYRKFVIKDGKKYAHTIDPRSGYPVRHNLLSATIVAPDAFLADAYATYCMAVGLDAAKEFISSRSDIDGCLIYDDEGVFRTWCSDGFVLETVPATSVK